MNYTVRNVVQVHAHWTSFTVASELKTMNPVLCHELRGREGVWWVASVGAQRLCTRPAPLAQARPTSDRSVPRVRR